MKKDGRRRNEKELSILPTTVEEEEKEEPNAASPASDVEPARDDSGTTVARIEPNVEEEKEVQPRPNIRTLIAKKRAEWER